MKISLKKRIARAFIFYAFDMLIAITGWIYGFGLHVANWTALIVIMLGARFFFHILTIVFAYQDAEAFRGSGNTQEGAK